MGFLVSNQVILQFLTSILLGLEYIGNPQLLMGALIRDEAGASAGVSTLLSDRWRSLEEVNFLNLRWGPGDTSWVMGDRKNGMGQGMVE